jgi:acyl carrier protein
MERVEEVFKEIIPDKLVESTTLRSLFLCPLDLAKLIGDLELEFGFEIADSDAESFKTVGDVVKYVNGRQSCSRKN